MPQVTVYIRNDDLEKWKAIEKKSEWLHNHLHTAITNLEKDLESTTKNPKKLKKDIEKLRKEVDKPFKHFLKDKK